MKLPNKLFVDTSFFIALMNSKDADHAIAVQLQEQVSATDIFEGLQPYLEELKLHKGIFEQSPIRNLIERYTSPESLQNGFPLYISAYESENLLQSRYYYSFN